MASTIPVRQQIALICLSLSLACTISAANIVFNPDKIPSNSKTEQFISDYNKNNDKLLKELFPYEIVKYPLTVPENMTYTNAEFQKFKGTYLEKTDDKRPMSYFSDIAMCGDSLTYHLGMKSLNRPLQNYDVIAYGGLLVSDFLTYTANSVYNQSSDKKNSLEWIAQLKPDVIYILLGTNGIAIYTNTGHINLYKTMLEKISAASPGSEIVVCSIPPWGLDCTTKISTTIPVLNKKINEYNMMLLELAHSKGYYFLNGAEIFYDAAGNMKSAYSSGDGIHWSTQARTDYLDYILSHPVPGF